jgi:hypothetical protein
MDIINGFFNKCAGAGCVPIHGADLLSYEGFDLDDAIWRKHRRLLRAGSR